MRQAERVASEAQGLILGVIRSMQAHDAETRRDPRAAERYAAESFELHTPGERPPEREAAVALFQRGRALEELARPAEALEAHERALAILRREDDPINSGSVLHDVDRCASDLGDADRAFAAYLDAARVFHELDVVDFTSNALCAAGLLLVDFLPQGGVREAAETDLVRSGLEDALDRARDVLLGAGQPTMGEALVVLRKFGGLLSLASFTRSEVALSKVADSLFWDVVEPFMARVQAMSRPSSERPPNYVADVLISVEI